MKEYYSLHTKLERLIRSGFFYEGGAFMDEKKRRGFDEKRMEPDRLDDAKRKQIQQERLGRGGF